MSYWKDTDTKCQPGTGAYNTFSAVKVRPCHPIYLAIFRKEWYNTRMSKKKSQNWVVMNLDSGEYIWVGESEGCATEREAADFYIKEILDNDPADGTCLQVVKGLPFKEFTTRTITPVTTFKLEQTDG